MSETAPEVTETEPVVDETPTTAETPDLGDSGKKALAAERSARRAAEKQAAELAAKVKEFEDASKSETEKAAARAEAAEERAKAAEAKALRVEIADELNVPKELREFLTAGDEDSLRAQANKVLEAFTAATAATRTTPRPDPTQGAKPGNDDSGQLTAADAARMTPEQIVAAKAAGRFNDLLGIKS